MNTMIAILITYYSRNSFCKIKANVANGQFLSLYIIVSKLPYKYTIFVTILISIHQSYIILYKISMQSLLKYKNRK